MTPIIRLVERTTADTVVDGGELDATEAVPRIAAEPAIFEAEDGFSTILEPTGATRTLLLTLTEDTSRAIGTTRMGTTGLERRGSEGGVTGTGTDTLGGGATLPCAVLERTPQATLGAAEEGVTTLTDVTSTTSLKEQTRTREATRRVIGGFHTTSQERFRIFHGEAPTRALDETGRTTGRRLTTFGEPGGTLR